MREKLILILFLISSGFVYGQESLNKKGKRMPFPICYASHESHKSFIRPPAGLKSGSQKKSTIKVDYIGFSTEAKLAFQYAVDVWQDLIYSPVPIHIKATWASLKPGVLGSCGPTDFIKNFNSTQIWNCYYPIALVEKMLGEEVNAENEYEMEANFNKDNKNWYFGTDGNTPPSRYDFVSVVMHELTHGLGFVGYFYSELGDGGYGYDGLAAVFDQFVVNKNGEKLIDKSIYTNPSTKLNLSLTSGWLEFNTSLTDNTLPRLWAPAKWDGGSSIYHLDENIYLAENPNSLMTPFSDMGEAIHDPGQYTLAIMNQMGWKSISIKHQPIKDMELASGPVNFDAQIESDYDLDLAKLFLVYSKDKFVKADSVLLSATTAPAIFHASLPANMNEGTQYYFSATDVKNRRFVFPSNAPSRYLSFNIGTDDTPPVLKHQPVEYQLITNPAMKIEVEATDNLGITSVKMEYFVNNEQSIEQTLINKKNDLYTGSLVFPKGTLKDGDVISYRLVAIDASTQKHTTTLPANEFFTYKVEGFSAVDSYANDFNTETPDFFGDDFKVASITGFDSPALNSAHPYLNSGTNDTTYNFTAILKYPIILKTGGTLSFDEIVLVEPSEQGTLFGDENFFDYVIVEGSKDGGISWNPLADGYDSRWMNSWLTLFNSEMSEDNNSTAVPTKDLLVKHEIDLLASGNFTAGDTILVRFRLYSDPLSVGWGWIIDNLVIKDLGTAVNPALLSSGQVNYFPNPANDRLTLQVQSKENIHQILLKAYNSSGKVMFSRAFSVGSNVFETDIDVSKFSPGLYLFAIEPENGQILTRKILIQ